VVTPQQWQRMWLAENKDEYKKNLAAKLWADVLTQTRSNEVVKDNHAEEKAALDKTAEEKPKEEKPEAAKEQIPRMDRMSTRRMNEEQKWLKQKKP
jgi:hypothetical protein